MAITNSFNNQVAFLEYLVEDINEIKTTWVSPEDEAFMFDNAKIAKCVTPVNGEVIVFDGNSGNIKNVPLAPGQTLIGNTEGLAEPANINAGTGIEIVNGEGAITIINANPVGLVWSVVNLSFQNLVNNHGYFVNSLSPVQFNLPLTANVGDTFVISGLSAASYVVKANAGQTIRINQFVSADAGILAPVSPYSSVYLVCSQANSAFVAVNGSGNWQIT